ncbi:hypothetical protein [Mucilaginibacter sp.]|uniref:hypothetical protein n=1 Tax=Mucilaginibacter sp. TaxID=1882438 RepID=UPI002615A6E4|nr:hypothetical protein [Mucilaginibacter sp.]MDB4924389.1 hypothetical protein [Mucilaginibacter sp.]
MKKLSFILVLAAAATLFACNGTPNKTGGTTRDSSASHDNSGLDTAFGAGVPEAESTSGTDTSTTGQVTDDPTADTLRARPKKHH